MVKGNVNRGRKAEGKQQYIRGEKRKAKALRGVREKDMEQDFEVKNLKKKVDKLTEASKGWSRYSISYSPATLVAQTASDGLGQGQRSIFLTPVVQTAVEGVASNGVNEFTGDSITIRSIRLVGQLSVNPAMSVPTALVPYLNVRLMVVCVHMPAGVRVGADGSNTTITYQELFQISNTMAPGATLTGENIYDQPYVNNMGNVTVYYDKIHTLTPPIYAAAVAGDANKQMATSGVGSFLHKFSINVIPTKKNSVVTFQSNNGATTQDAQSVSTNAWYLLAFSDNQTAADANKPSLIGSAILKYTY